MERTSTLRAVRLLHTVVWAGFASCVVVIPFLAWARQFRPAVIASAAVMVEVGILAWNGWRCPLTPIAARYTEDRRPNFDIYLPEWLARYNKEIFGSLYVGGLVTLLGRWMGWF